MAHKFLYFIIFLLIVACKPYFYATDTVTNELGSFDLKKFDLYTFQLVKKDTALIHPVFTNGLNKTEMDLVYEELYLFLEKKGNIALYLTTFSHKYIYKDGVFNRDFNFNKISVNEIDFIFVGNYNKDKITFKNPKKEDVDAIELYYSRIGDNLKLEKITNNYGLRKDRDINHFINMNEVFAVDIVYQKDLRKFVYQQENQEEIVVESLAINTDNLYFGLAKNNPRKYKMIRNRVANDFAR